MQVLVIGLLIYWFIKPPKFLTGTAEVMNDAAEEVRRRREEENK